MFRFVSYVFLLSCVTEDSSSCNFTSLLSNCCNVHVMVHSDTMDSVKQSAALCLLRLYKTSPDLVLMGEWTSRVVHLLNDQHMVRV